MNLPNKVITGTMFAKGKRQVRTLTQFMLLAGLPASLFAVEEAPQYPSPDRYEGVIRNFEASESMQPPPLGAVLCIGSSSMRMWNKYIREDLTPLTIIPRGFGGSNMNDVLYYFDRVVIPYRPRAILLYEGDNDTAAGIDNDTILEKFQEFFGRVHEILPECRIYVIAVKPSIQRVGILEKVQELNKTIEQVCSSDERLTFLDVSSPMLGEDGLPLTDIFIEDNLHLNRKGYRIWRDAIRPALLEGELKHEKSVLLHTDFDSNLDSGVAQALLDNPFVELAEGAGVEGSDGICVSYVGYEHGSKRVVVTHPLSAAVEKATLQFDVRFDEDFQWVHGGKLHGLGPERPVTGGRERRPDGWSARTMFKEDGKIATYLYDQDTAKKYGVGETTDEPVFTAGKWYRVELEVRLNDPDEPNGYARVRVDGKDVLLTVGVVYRGQEGEDTLISQLYFSTFHGGNTSSWAPVNAAGEPATVHAFFDNFLVRTTADR